MNPTYQIRVWPDDDWWLARVVAASEGADTAPLNALTQARSLAKIESMARDLVATILDTDEGAFDVNLDFDLPADVGELVCQAKGARAWLEAAQDLWQERSTVAAKALAEKGYSLRETATLLGLSHQRVDQLLGSHADRESNRFLLFQVKHLTDIHCTNANRHLQKDVAQPCAADAFVVVRAYEPVSWSDSAYSLLEAKLEETLRIVWEQASKVRCNSDVAELDGADAK